MISWQKILLSILTAAGLGYAGGRFVQPAKVVTQIKEITKTVEVVKHDTVTTTHETKRPDGTTETNTTTVNHDVDMSHSSTTDTITKITDNLKPQWKVSGQAGYNFSNFQRVYGAEIDCRIIGPIFLGVWGNTNHTGGLSVGLEF